VDEQVVLRPGGAERLRDALQRLAGDQLDHRLEIDPDDPLADVAEAVNAVAGALRARRDETVRAVEMYCLRRFGTVLVHDLKNLAARLSFVPVNLRAAPSDLETVEACAATVADTVDRLQSLVRRFRDQREAMVLRRPGDLNRAVEAALRTSGAAASPGIHTEVHLEPLPPAIVDLPYLEEAFVNLLRNAVEAMPRGGCLQVRTRLRADGPHSGLAEVAVTDDGPGMTPEFIDRDLFAPFRSTKAGGLGLGMFSCRETVEIHGGRIEVESAPGRGTTFRVLLPVAPPAGNAP
jgi:signal transduction histidine kinase